MTVVDFHPEDLFDKLRDGRISATEQERLRAHLEACAVCRFESGVRLDFMAEARRADSIRRPPIELEPHPVAAFEPRGVGRPRALVRGLAGAGLIAASGALAAVLEPTWAAFGTAPAASAQSIPNKGVARSAAAPASALVQPSEPEQPAPEKNALPARPLGSHHARPNSVPRVTGARENQEPEATSAAELFAEANRARREQQLDRAARLYLALQQRYPGSAEAELSRVTQATLLLDRGEAAQALVGFERYLAGPSRALEVEAWVGRARALERLGRNSDAIRAWERVLSRFPQTIHARLAAERLSSLRRP